VLDGQQGRVTVTAQGVRHEISLRVDRIRQRPVIEHQQKPFVRQGTTVKLHWPDLASSILETSTARFLQIAAAYTFLIPPLALAVDSFGEEHPYPALDHGWRKWLPSHPTSSHWYDLERFTRLISAYLAHDADNGRQRTAREFVAEFDGLAGSVKQSRVLEQT